MSLPTSSCKVRCRTQFEFLVDVQNPDSLNFGGKWVILCTKGKSEGRQMSLGPTHQDTSPHARNWHPCHEVLWDRRACGDKQLPPNLLHAQLPAVCTRDSQRDWHFLKLFCPRSHLASSHKIIQCPSPGKKMIPGWMGRSGSGVTQHCGVKNLVCRELQKRF